MNITQMVPNWFFGMLDFRDFKVKMKARFRIESIHRCHADVVNDHQDYGTEEKFGLWGCHQIAGYIQHVQCRQEINQTATGFFWFYLSSIFL